LFFSLSFDCLLHKTKIVGKNECLPFEIAAVAI